MGEGLERKTILAIVSFESTLCELGIDVLGLTGELGMPNWSHHSDKFWMTTQGIPTLGSLG